MPQLSYLSPLTTFYRSHVIFDQTVVFNGNAMKIIHKMPWNGIFIHRGCNVLGTYQLDQLHSIHWLKHKRCGPFTLPEYNHMYTTKFKDCQRLVLKYIEQSSFRVHHVSSLMQTSNTSPHYIYIFHRTEYIDSFWYYSKHRLCIHFFAAKSEVSQSSHVLSLVDDCFIRTSYNFMPIHVILCY